MLAACAWRLSQRAVTFPPRVRSQILNPFPMAAAASPKRLRVYSSGARDGDSSDGTGSGKRVGTHNGSFHCDEALGCFLIRLTSQFASADVVRTRDPQELLPFSIHLIPELNKDKSRQEFCSSTKLDEGSIEVPELFKDLLRSNSKNFGLQ